MPSAFGRFHVPRGLVVLVFYGVVRRWLAAVDDLETLAPVFRQQFASVADSTGRHEDADLAQAVHRERQDRVRNVRDDLARDAVGGHS